MYGTILHYSVLYCTIQIQTLYCTVLDSGTFIAQTTLLGMTVEVGSLAINNLYSGCRSGEPQAGQLRILLS